MSKWDANLYLKFGRERTQPAVDLINRIRHYAPKAVLDIGCGSGNSTAMLAQLLPDAKVTGVDNSEQMLKKARELHPELEFRLCDISSETDSLPTGYDLIFSNACLQWVSDHKTLIPKLFLHLKKGGCLAVQIPNNTEEPLFRAIFETAAEPKWGLNLTNTDKNEILSPEQYYDILSELTDDFDVWEQVYYHTMENLGALIEWVRSTRLRPYLAELDCDEARAGFEAAILEKAKPYYTTRKNNRIILKFRRLFFTAVK